MFDTPHETRDHLTSACSWIATRGIETRSWPSCGARPASDPPDHPVLYLVDDGVEPPACSELEDWLRLPIDSNELDARADRLIARSRRLGAVFTRVDEDDLLRVGDDIVVLSLLEARLMRVLIEAMGKLVPRTTLEEAVWPDGLPDDPRALDNRIKAVRKRIAEVPLELHTVHARGFVLDRTADGGS